MGLESKKDDRTTRGLLCKAGWCATHQRLVPSLEGAVRAPTAGPFKVELPGPTTILCSDFTLSACSPNGRSFEATETIPGQELRPVLDNTMHFKPHKAGFEGYYRITIRDPLTAPMTIKDMAYFKAANHHLMLVSL